MTTKSSRPLSPHLHVYKPQLTSVLSIFHRITGTLLSVGALIIVAVLLSLLGGADSYYNTIGYLDNWLGHLFMWGWCAAFFYHLLNGIRHLCWDAGKGFELKEAYKSGYAVLCTAGFLTLFAIVYAYV